MKSKIIASLILGIFLLVSFASAAEISLNKQTIELTKNINSTTFTVTNANTTNLVDITFDKPTILTEDNKEITFSINPELLNDLNGTQTFNLQMLGDFLDFKFGEYTGILTVFGEDPAGDVDAENVTINYVSSFCEAGPVGNDLRLTEVDINNLVGDDDDEWRPLDIIEIEVSVENRKNNDEIEDVIVELGLFDGEGNNQAGDLDFENSGDEEIDMGDIDEDDEETVTFRFQVPGDFDADNYKLAVKAYSDDLGENDECTDELDGDLNNDFYQTISVDLEEDEDKAIVLDNINIQNEAICGESVSGSFTVYNIGEEDQDRVMVIIFNNELDLILEEEITSDLDSGEGRNIDFSFVVPNDADVKEYTLGMKTYSDYDDKDDTYDEESEDTWTASFDVVACGNTGGNGGNILIAPTLQSAAVAGEEMVVRVSFTNIGNSESTYTVNARGYEGWASLDSVSQRIITLEGGESQAVEFTFTINKGVSGANSFIIEAVSNGAVETREVKVNVEGGFSFDLGGSTLIWIIVAVNVLLIILIIIVAVRLSRR